MAELDLVGGMILINRIQQKGWNDSLCLGYQRQCFHLASIRFSHSGSDRESNWGQRTQGRLTALKEQPVNSHWVSLDADSAPVDPSPVERVICPQSASWWKPCEWGAHPSWFAWKPGFPWDVGFLVLRPGRSWAKWDDLIILRVRDSEPEDPQKLRW